MITLIHKLVDGFLLFKMKMNYYLFKLIPNYVHKNHVLEYASEIGDLHTIKYLYQHENTIVNTDELLFISSKNGNDELTKYLLSKVTNVSRSTFLNTVIMGNLNIVKLLIPYFSDENILSLAINEASRKGNLEMVKYLFSVSKENLNDIKVINSSILFASWDGNLDVLEYLISIGGNITLVKPKPKQYDISKFIYLYKKNPELMLIKLKNKYLMQEHKYLSLMILYTEKYLKHKKNENNNIIKFFNMISKLNLDCQMIISNRILNKKTEYISKYNSFISDKDIISWLFLD